MHQTTGKGRPVTTVAFADAVIDRLGETPVKLQPSCYPRTPIQVPPLELPEPVQKSLVGVDVFIDWSENDRNPDVLGRQLEAIAGTDLKLKMITNRGVKVYPNGLPETFCTDHWRCRFVAKDYGQTDATAHVAYRQIVELLERLMQSGLNFIKTENLYEIEGRRAYSLGQGE